MTKRKFYRTVLSIEVLSEEPIPPGTSIESVIYEANEGGYSMREMGEIETELDGKETADALVAQGSDPGFFRLTDDGEDVE